MTARLLRLAALLPFAAVLLPLEAAEAASLPLFARRYGVACTHCHAIPPKLNSFGEAFRRSGYRAMGTGGRSSFPFAVWISGRRDDLPQAAGLGDEVSNYLNRIEVISGGRIVAPQLSYFVEWRPLSKETRADGTLRDRSGRFEDIYLTATAGPLSFSAGQFRLVDQVDVSLRLGLSEPLALAAGLAGSGPGSSREVGLRGFAPGARSPALRVGWTAPAGGWSLTSSLAVPFPGEFSIPLSDAARVEASNELELDPKGVVLESFLRRGVHSSPPVRGAGGAHGEPLGGWRGNRVPAVSPAPGAGNPLYDPADDRAAGAAGSQYDPDRAGDGVLIRRCAPK